MIKVDFPIDKREWHPSLIPGPVYLVGTYDTLGVPNIAPKSWIQMVSFEPSILMFSGSLGEHTTEKNIIDTECFTLNSVDSSIAERVYSCTEWYGLERIEKTGFTLKRATKIIAPLVIECRAHLECSLLETHSVGNSLVVYGEIVAATIWSDISDVDKERRYGLLDQVLFLEDDLFGKIGSVKRRNGG